MYDYPNAVTNEQYQTLVMQGGVKNGVIPCAEVQFYESVLTGTVIMHLRHLLDQLLLLKVHDYLCFREPIEGL